MKAKKPKWALDPATVGVCLSSSRGRHGRMQRVSACCRLELIHMPTGITVTGEVPRGHHSKKELWKLSEALRERLFANLEAMVAKHLRIPGR